MFLLDTNVFIRIAKHESPEIAERFRKVPPGKIALCSIVKAELYYGAFHSQRVGSNLELLEGLFEPLPSLPFDDRCAETAGRIRADLRAKGTPIGANDLLIAATALAHDAVLVTHNTREFARVPGLRLEDWEC